jgi:hypothetical protein
MVTLIALVIRKEQERGVKVIFIKEKQNKSKKIFFNSYYIGNLPRGKIS